MVKLVALIRRAEGLSREDMKAWWMNDHKEIVRRFPGLLKYVVNWRIPTAFDVADQQTFDGFAELWFDSVGDAAAAYASEVAQLGKADTEAHVEVVLRFIVEEHEVPLPS